MFGPGPALFAPAAGGGGGSDPYWSFVTMLLKLDANFADSSPSAFTVTAEGATPPTIVASPSKFGGGSADLTANSNSRLDIATAANAGFDFAGGDFAIDLFAYRQNAGAGDRHILDAWSGRFLLRYSGSTLQFFAAGVASPILQASQTWGTDSTWHMVTVARSGSSWGLWFDGTSINTATNASAISSSNSSLYIGNSASGDGFGGYIGPLRFTKGSARGYVPGVGFTPDTVMFPTS
jgi:hypothetical protein